MALQMNFPLRGQARAQRGVTLPARRTTAFRGEPESARAPCVFVEPHELAISTIRRGVILSLRTWSIESLLTLRPWRHALATIELPNPWLRLIDAEGPREVWNWRPNVAYWIVDGDVTWCSKGLASNEISRTCRNLFATNSAGDELGKMRRSSSTEDDLDWSWVLERPTSQAPSVVNT